MFRGGFRGAISWTTKVMRIIGILMQRVASNQELASMASRIPEERSATIVLFDEYGNRLEVCMTAGPSGVKMHMGECSRPNNRISMDINVLLDLLEGKVDFRTAVAHGKITIESFDGRPWFYHFVLWSQVWNMIARVVKQWQGGTA